MLVNKNNLTNFDWHFHSSYTTGNFFLLYSKIGYLLTRAICPQCFPSVFYFPSAGSMFFPPNHKLECLLTSHEPQNILLLFPVCLQWRELISSIRNYKTECLIVLLEPLILWFLFSSQCRELISSIKL